MATNYQTKILNIMGLILAPSFAKSDRITYQLADLEGRNWHKPP